MSKKEILYSFIFYSIVGWGLDTLARSVYDMRFVSENWLGIPFSPCYGIGALGFLFLYRYVRTWKFWEQFVMYATVSAAYEYTAGVVSIVLLNRRLWDYKDIPWNLHGHTDPFHALIWGMLAMLVTHRLQPWLHATFAQPKKLQ